MERTWWYASGSEKKGPVSLDDIRQLLAAGNIKVETLCWNTGMSQWMALGEIAELHEVLRSVPPDIPVRPVSAPEPAMPEPPAFPSTRHVPQSPPSPLAKGDAAGRWRRFFARFVDLYLLSVPLGLALGYWGGQASVDFALWVQQPGSSLVLGLLILPLALLIESVIFGLFGTTLGKALLGVRVLTDRLERPSFFQYVERQIGVYCYGLALGIPLVYLATLVRQSSRVKKGLAASYDQHRFVVQASRLGVLRTAAAVIVCATIFLAYAVLAQFDKQQSSQSYVASAWTNPVTGRATVLATGWTYTTQKGDAGQEIVVFTNALRGTVLIFAYEDIGRDISLTRYGEAWRTAVKDTMVVEMGREARDSAGRSVLRGEGKMVEKATSYPMNVVMTLSGGRVWRVIVFGDRQEQLLSADIELARERLLGTL